LRVGMRFESAPVNCQNDDDFGEFEDYCINVQPPMNTGIIHGSAFEMIIIAPNPFAEAIYIRNVPPGSFPMKYGLYQIDGRLVFGTLESGKDATLIVSAGDALDMRSNDIEIAFLEGRAVDLNNKQKMLYEKFRNKYFD